MADIESAYRSSEKFLQHIPEAERVSTRLAAAQQHQVDLHSQPQSVSESMESLSLSATSNLAAAPPLPRLNPYVSTFVTQEQRDEQAESERRRAAMSGQAPIIGYPLYGGTEPQ